MTLIQQAINRLRALPVPQFSEAFMAGYHYAYTEVFKELESCDRPLDDESIYAFRERLMRALADASFESAPHGRIATMNVLWPLIAEMYLEMSAQVDELRITLERRGHAQSCTSRRGESCDCGFDPPIEATL
jgi:hypothetical protein